MDLPESRTYIDVKVRDGDTFAAIDWAGGERPRWWNTFAAAESVSIASVVWSVTWSNDVSRLDTVYDLDQLLWDISPSAVEGEAFEYEDAFRELFLKAPIFPTVPLGALNPRATRPPIPSDDAVPIGGILLDAVHCFEAGRYALARVEESRRWLKAHERASEDYVLTLADRTIKGAQPEDFASFHRLFDPDSELYIGASPDSLLAMIKRNGGGRYYLQELAEEFANSRRAERVREASERRWKEAVEREFKWQRERVAKSYFIPRTSDEREALKLHRAAEAAPSAGGWRAAAKKKRDEFIRERLALPELEGSVYEQAYRQVTDASASDGEVT